MSRAPFLPRSKPAGYDFGQVSRSVYYLVGETTGLTGFPAGPIGFPIGITGFAIGATGFFMAPTGFVNGGVGLVGETDGERQFLMFVVEKVN